MIPLVGSFGQADLYIPPSQRASSASAGSHDTGICRYSVTRKGIYAFIPRTITVRDTVLWCRNQKGKKGEAEKGEETPYNEEPPVNCNNGK